MSSRGFTSLNVGKHLRICFFVSFSVPMSLSLSVSSSLDSCVSVVVVDLEACREPSGEAVALHAHEAVGGGRRADCGPNLWGHLCGRRAESTSTGCCRQRAAGRRQQGNITNLEIGRFFQSAWAVFGTSWKGSWDAGISSWAVFAAPGVLLEGFSILLSTSRPVFSTFGHLLGRLGSLLGLS